MDKLDQVDAFVRHHIFARIFNYSRNSLRNNTKLVNINHSRPVRGSVYNNVIQVELPDQDNFYYLYICSATPLSNLVNSVTEWTTLSDVSNDLNIRLDVYSEEMRLMSKSSSYVRSISAHQVAIIVPQKVFNRYGIPRTTDMYLTISDDTDGVDDRTIISHSPIVANTWDSITASISDPSNAGKITVLVNGWDYEPSVVPSLVDPSLDFVDIVIDHNIVISFTQSLENRATYYSPGESLYKDIVAVPESLNPSNTVYTFDTFDISVRDTDTGKGLPLQFIAEQSVSQLTHDAIGVSSYIIDALFDTLVGDHYELVVKVSDFDKGNENWENGDFTKRLYLETPEVISSAFMNGLYPKVPVWTAARLESSSYARYLTELGDITIPAHYRVASQISGLGYHSFVVLIGRHSGQVPTPDATLTSFFIRKPIYWESSPLEVLLFSNGMKVRDDRYRVTSDSGGTIEVTVSPELVLPNDRDVQYTVIDKPTCFSFIKSPISTDRALSFPNTGSKFRVYRKVASSYHDHLGLLSNDAYDELVSGGNRYFAVHTNEDEHILYFSEAAYGETFIVSVEDHANVQLLYSRNISDGSALHFLLTTRADTGVSIPILVAGEYEVYLNGRYLILGLDYQIFNIMDSDGFTKGNDLVIQNKRWILDTNDVEIYKTNTHTKTSETGRVIDRRIPCTASNEAWFEGLSKLIVNGRLISPARVTREKDHFLLDAGVSTNGNAYHFCVPINNALHSQYLQYEESQYQADRNSITNYYANMYDYENNQPIIVPEVHRVYSTYITEVIKRILTGVIPVTYVNDDDAILDQINSLDWLRQYDLVLLNNLIDTDYDDVYPIALDNVTAPDLNTYLFINRFVTILIGDDHITDHDVIFQRA